jgi:hypothetical protein
VTLTRFASVLQQDKKANQALSSPMTLFFQEHPLFSDTLDLNKVAFLDAKMSEQSENGNPLLLYYHSDSGRYFGQVDTVTSGLAEVELRDIDGLCQYKA